MHRPLSARTRTASMASVFCSRGPAHAGGPRRSPRTPPDESSEAQQDDSNDVVERVERAEADRFVIQGQRTPVEDQEVRSRDHQDDDNDSLPTLRALSPSFARSLPFGYQHFPNTWRTTRGRLAEAGQRSL